MTPQTNDRLNVNYHRCAVIGFPVTHSLSPVLHNSAYRSLGLDNWTYDRLAVDARGLSACLKEMAAPAQPGAPLWHGLSVTMPHKQAVIPHLDMVDPLAQVTGAVNTVIAQRAGDGPALLTGFNTDVAGISGAIREMREIVQTPETDTQHAVVLGSGATACSALAALTELGAEQITVAARRHAGPGRALSAAHRMGLDIDAFTWSGDEASNKQVAHHLSQAELVVSTLPAGAADALAEHLSGVLLPPSAVLLDVVYDPWPTRLAQSWQQAGGTIAPGWLMLLHQALPQVRLMTGREAPIDAVRSALKSALAAR